MNRLFEAVLFEADKTRFIDQLFVEKTHVADDELKRKGLELPSRDDLIRWVNSGAADNYHLDWNRLKKDPVPFYKDIVKAYNEWLQKKSKQGTTKSVTKTLRNSKMFHFIKETDDWIFAAPMSHDVCEWCDSSIPGGKGAKWCVGWHDNYEHWNDYTEAGIEFIFALSKKPELFGTDDVKYMIQIGDGYYDNKLVKTWRQTDHEEETLGRSESKDLFGIDPIALTKEYPQEEFYEDISQYYYDNAPTYTDVDYEDVSSQIERRWTCDPNDGSLTLRVGRKEYNNDCYISLYDIAENCVNAPDLKEIKIVSYNMELAVSWLPTRCRGVPRDFYKIPTTVTIADGEPNGLFEIGMIQLPPDADHRTLKVEADDYTIRELIVPSLKEAKKFNGKYRELSINPLGLDFETPSVVGKDVSYVKTADLSMAYMNSSVVYLNGDSNFTNKRFKISDYISLSEDKHIDVVLINFNKGGHQILLDKSECDYSVIAENCSNIVIVGTKEDIKKHVTDPSTSRYIVVKPDSWSHFLKFDAKMINQHIIAETLNLDIFGNIIGDAGMEYAIDKITPYTGPVDGVECEGSIVHGVCTDSAHPGEDLTVFSGYTKESTTDMILAKVDVTNSGIITKEYRND